MPSSAPDHPSLHSFPTRRSSDLPQLLHLDIDSLTDHFQASRFSYSTQALPVNVLLDTLVRPNGDTDDAEGNTNILWQYLPEKAVSRSEEHTSELQSHSDLVCRLLPPTTHLFTPSLHDALPIFPSCFTSTSTASRTTSRHPDSLTPPRLSR